MILTILICFPILSVSAFPVEDFQIENTDVTFYFYSISNPTKGILTNFSDSEDVAKTNFSASKDTYFCIHGWRDARNSTLCQMVKNNLLLNHDINVFIVDWDNISYTWNYLLAVVRVEPVGRTMGSKIQDLIESSGLQLNRTVVVGHSLGAHIAGVAGRVLEGQLNHIVGLDPAGPLFLSIIKENRLTTSRAKFVQVIHTNGGVAGYYDPLGHADYYPNGGRFQPKCMFDSQGACSHMVSFDYYAESLLTGGFKARKCESYDDFRNGTCDDAEISMMGEYDVDKNNKGTYFLDTNNESPYAKD